MKKYLLNSEDCFEAYNPEEDCWEVGDYDYFSEKNTNIDPDTIQFSQFYWEDEVRHFYDFVRSEKEKYEKRYKTEIIGLALSGRIGLWNRSPVGGKIVDFDDIFQMNVDDIDVTVEEGDVICINGHHHDGCHHMNLYFLTESNMKKIKIWKIYDNGGFGDFEGDEFEQIYYNLTPLKLPKDNDYYSYNYYVNK